MGKYNITTDPQQCRWQTKASFTIQWVGGQDLHIDQVLYQVHCNSTQPFRYTPGYLLPLDDTWWVCSSGLTLCAHVMVLNTT